MLAVWTVEFEDGQQVTDSGSHDSHHARRCLHWLTNTGFKLQGSGLESCAAREFYRQVAESTNQEAARGGKKNGDLMSASVWALGSRILHGSNFLPHKLRRLHPVARSVVGRQAGVCTPADFRHPLKKLPLCSLLNIHVGSRQAMGTVMKDSHAKFEKLLTEAEDCELIGRLATDIKKRQLFKKLAADLRSMARDIEAVVAGRAPEAE